MIYAHIVSEEQKIEEKTIISVQVIWFSDSPKRTDEWQAKIEKFREKSFNKEMPLIHNLFRFFAQNKFIPAGINGDKERIFYLK